jgi:murein L,D-transpeptidase YafK
LPGDSDYPFVKLSLRLWPDAAWERDQLLLLKRLLIVVCLLSLSAVPPLVAGFIAPPAAAHSSALGKADEVLVLKGERRLLLLRGGAVLKSYKVALGREPQGYKVREGDGRTPEGRYVLDWRNPKSRFYRSIHVSYPNHRDAARARALRVPAGGEIMIHGAPNGLGFVGRLVGWDWTEGCIAVTNAEMDEIWQAVDDGTPIEIRP